ncbi:MAG: hypothetical protein HWN68_11125 [Desulfobacterales bacterium]|nr:hypothetical protein [Desulfobacterales bacterium]
MDVFIGTLLSRVSIEVVIIILVAVNLMVSGLNYKNIRKVEGYFIDHLKNHAKKGGDN